MKVIGYIRVSTDKQANEGVSLEAQRLALRKECERRDWELVSILEDELSGKSLSRPGLQRAMNLLGSKRKAVAQEYVLMATKLDRLSRSVMDVCQIGVTAKTQGWSIVLLDCGIDTTTPHGKAQLQMMAVFAELERELIGQRTREALAVKKAQGVTLGRRPQISRDVQDRIVLLRQKGLSYAKIAKSLNRNGVPTVNGGQWRASTIERVLERA